MRPANSDRSRASGIIEYRMGFRPKLSCRAAHRYRHLPLGPFCCSVATLPSTITYDLRLHGLMAEFRTPISYVVTPEACESPSPSYFDLKKAPK